MSNSLINNDINEINEINDSLLSDSISDIDNNNNNNNINNNLNQNEDLLNLSIEQKYKSDYEILINLGYESNLLKKVFKFLKPNDINDALDLMEEKDGIFQHEFMEGHSGINNSNHQNKCFICGNPPQIHIGYNNNNEYLINNINNINHNNNNTNDIIIKINNIDNVDLISGNGANNTNNNTNNNTLDNNSTDDGNSSSNKNNRTLFICQLCEDEISLKEKEENSLKCNHLFCSECFFNFFKDKILENKIGKITCMQNGCQTVFSESFIISHLQEDSRLIKKYQKFKTKNDLYNAPDIKFCPVKDCESFARKIGDNKYVTCENGHKFCFNCSKPWHGKKKCSEEIDKDFKKWKKNKLVKRCPKCRMWTEKNHGCNHIYCAECHYQWCWICGREYQEGHFDLGGGCSGLQFTYSSCFDKWVCIFLYRLMVLIGQTILITFGFLPVSSFFYLTINTTDRRGGIFNNMVFMGVMFLGWFFWMIPFIGICVCVTAMICVPSLFYWPLQEKIMRVYYNKVFNN